MKYEKHFEEDGEQISCDNCNYTTEVRKYDAIFEHSPFEKKQIFLCEICSQTFLSHAMTSPSQHADPQLMRDIGWIANMLRDEIRKLKRDSK